MADESLRAEIRTVYADVLALRYAVAALVRANPLREAIIDGLREQAAMTPSAQPGTTDLRQGLHDLLRLLDRR